MRTSQPRVSIDFEASMTQETDRPPNPGLDAFTAQNVMQTLRDLASDGRTIVVSIHQPRSDIWQMFDNALLLVKGGRTAYSGPANAILPFFAKVGKECPPHFKYALVLLYLSCNRSDLFLPLSPADFVIDAVSVDYHSVEEEAASKASIDHLVAAWKKQKGIKDKDETAPLARPAAGQNLSAKLRKTPFSRAFPVVLARSFKCACSSSFRRKQSGGRHTDGFLFQKSSPTARCFHRSTLKSAFDGVPVLDLFRCARFLCATEKLISDDILNCSDSAMALRAHKIASVCCRWVPLIKRDLP